MIKNKEATDSAAVEFCSYFEQIADSSNWAANLFKIWQNSNAALSVASLFFIIYQKSKVWTITRLKNLSRCILNIIVFYFDSGRQILLLPI